MERFNGAVKVGTSSLKLGAAKLGYVLYTILFGIMWVFDKIFWLIRKTGFILGTAFFFTWFVCPATGVNDVRQACTTFFYFYVWREKNGIIAIAASILLGLILWVFLSKIAGGVRSGFEYIKDVREMSAKACGARAKEIERYSKIAKGDMADEYRRLCERYRETNVNYVSRL